VKQVEKEEGDGTFMTQTNKIGQISTCQWDISIISNIDISIKACRHGCFIYIV
jgi:hypothetical protein